MTDLKNQDVLSALASGKMDKNTLKLFMQFEEEKRNRVKQLYSKLAQIRAGMGSMPKDGTNKHFNYDYISADSVFRTCQALLLKNRVEMPVAQVEARKEGKNTRVQLLVTFVDLDTGHQESFPWWGEANDSQDKGSSKAQTLGQKYFLLRYFLVPPDEDPDGGPSPENQSGRQQGNQPSGDESIKVSKRPYAPKVLKAKLLSLAEDKNQNGEVATDDQSHNIQVAIVQLLTVYAAEKFSKDLDSPEKQQGWAKIKVSSFLNEIFGVQTTSGMKVGQVTALEGWITDASMATKEVVALIKSLAK